MPSVSIRVTLSMQCIFRDLFLHKSTHQKTHCLSHSCHEPRVSNRSQNSHLLTLNDWSQNDSLVSAAFSTPPSPPSPDRFELRGDNTASCQLLPSYRPLCWPDRKRVCIEQRNRAPVVEATRSRKWGVYWGVQFLLLRPHTCHTVRGAHQ